MNQKLHHGIVYGEQDTLIRKSCVIFNGCYCLAPATILLDTFEKLRSEIQSIANHDLYRDLKYSRMIDTKVDRRYHSLAQHSFKVIYEQNDVLYKSNAFIVNIFKCRNIWNSFNDILRNFVARSQSSENNDLHKMLLSSFVILQLKTTEASSRDQEVKTSASLNIFNEIMTCINGKNEPRTSVFRMNNVRKLENIESITTPFGNECFLNTINVGRIANIFGDDKCLMVASMPLVNGCEGGAVYNKNQELIGIVISTTFDWNSENATLTLVAKFNEIMAEFVQQSKLTTIDIEDEIGRCPNEIQKAGNCMVRQSATLENFIVLIQSADSWGTGCFVKINDTRMIITCSHVLENSSGSVRCTWKFGNFSSKIIFKNPDFDTAFDIAILEVPQNVPDQYFTRCHTSPTKIGQTVYSSGFPHFTSLGRNPENFFPSIFEGRITKISKGVLFSDASVQSGQSGGPMFSDDGRLLGVCISNSKDDAVQLIYPNINMSVPVYDILPVLQKYGTTKGKFQTEPNFFSRKS